MRSMWRSDEVPHHYRNLLTQADLSILQMLLGATVAVSIDQHGRFINSIVFETESGARIKMQAAGEDHEAYFETFRLMVSKQETSLPPKNLCRLFGIVSADILLREESIGPASDADMEGLLGSTPANVQFSHLPGGAPDGAMASALVASGVLLTDTTARKLAIYADTFPYAMRILVDEGTDHLSGEYEILPLAGYRTRYPPD